ncbi:hypothetical protein PR048_031824 [Dryococelus australis]|uniref:Uncharacterized protein n=1 Tax=Dryococelus australis TaxID=614101 RepID=A0ABQ9G6D8_9NEOP|nr:hypothetical protein PR048_031824 [Dryococelus australis]
MKLCSRAVVETSKYDIKYDNVCAFVSDSARYTKKRVELMKVLKKYHYLEFLKKASLKHKLFPSPVLTRWNAWLKSVEYLDEYLNIIAEFFKQHSGEGSDATQYFQNLSNDAILILQCEAKFVVEQCKKTLHAKLTELKNVYKFVSDRSFGDQTVKLLKTTACRKAATEATLAAARQKSYLKLSSMLGGEPEKDIL